MNEKSDNLINKIIFGKYKICRILGKGAFCNVYVVKNIRTQYSYAAKIEEKSSSLGYLEKEAFFLFLLKGFGIPQVISYGHSGKYNILIQKLLGKSLSELFKTIHKKDKIKDLCIASIQIIERMKYIHSKNIIHRDIKPENFLIGNPDISNIYIIDFGLSRKFRSSRTGKHIDYYINKTVPGTIRYLSLNASMGIEQTRRDDLESIAYMLIYLGKGNLPWSFIRSKNRMEVSIKTFKMKKYISVEELCNGLPIEFTYFTKYVRSLKFEEEPLYESIKKIFESALKNINGEYDLNFSWERKLQKINLKKESENFKSRKQNIKLYPNIRLFKKLEELRENSYINNNLSVNTKKYFDTEEVSKNTEYKKNKNLTNYNSQKSINFNFTELGNNLNIYKNDQFHKQLKNFNSPQIIKIRKKVYNIKSLNFSSKNENDCKKKIFKIIPINKISQNGSKNKIQISLRKNNISIFKSENSPKFKNNYIQRTKYLSPNINKINTNIKCIPLAIKKIIGNRCNSFTNTFKNNLTKKYSPINRSNLLINKNNDEPKNRTTVLKKQQKPSLKIKINSFNSSSVFNVRSNSHLSINSVIKNSSIIHKFKRFPYIKPKRIASYDDKSLKKYIEIKTERNSKNKDEHYLKQLCKFISGGKLIDNIKRTNSDNILL